MWNGGRTMSEDTKSADGNEADAAQIARLRARVRESFGSVAMTMMMLPQYRNQTVADLQHLILEPLVQDRISIAYPKETPDPEGGDKVAADMVGFAIWASASDEVDRRIRDQIKAGTYPIRLKPDDWRSGDNHWVLDIIAPDEAATTKVLANFGQLAKGGSLKLHPAVARRLSPEVLEKMGAVQATGEGETN